jgi:hypothetical protein
MEFRLQILYEKRPLIGLVLDDFGSRLACAMPSTSAKQANSYAK